MTDIDDQRRAAMNELALEMGLIAMAEPDRGDGLVRYALIDRNDIMDYSCEMVDAHGHDAVFQINITLKPQSERIVVSFDAQALMATESGTVASTPTPR